MLIYIYMFAHKSLSFFLSLSLSLHQTSLTNPTPSLKARRVACSVSESPMYSTAWNHMGRLRLVGSLK